MDARILLLLVIVTGCTPVGVVGPVNSRSERQSWEYFCLVGRDPASLTHAMNQAGAKGWELAAAVGSGTEAMWCFKRPKFTGWD